MDKVICDKRRTCTYSDYCGGSKPHFSESECNNCPKNKEARCVSYKMVL